MPDHNFARRGFRDPNRQFDRNRMRQFRQRGPRPGPEGEVDESQIDHIDTRVDFAQLEAKNLPELKELAKEFGVTGTTTFKKTDLVYKILEAHAGKSGYLFRVGLLESLPDGFGFMRLDGHSHSPEDVYVSQSQIKRFCLKTGDTVYGTVRAPKEGERYFSLLRVEAVNGRPAEVARTRKDFDKLIPIHPIKKFDLECEGEISTRLLDMIAPIGYGQRALITAPPKAGKTSLLKAIANSIAKNHPEVHLIILLIDERPEEVTDIRRSVRAEVVDSTFDREAENHMRVAELTLEKAKRLLECERDVVILLDSITRYSRASNLTVNPSGRTFSGGIDPAAMFRPKRFFGAARQIDGGGSITIIATALVDTGSRGDEYIYEEFKGTGNCDIFLDRDLFNRRIFPNVDVKLSGTRHEELLIAPDDLKKVWHMRRMLNGLDTAQATELLVDRLKHTKLNREFLALIEKTTRGS